MIFRENREKGSLQSIKVGDITRIPGRDVFKIEIHRYPDDITVAIKRWCLHGVEYEKKRDNGGSHCR